MAKNKIFLTTAVRISRNKTLNVDNSLTLATGEVDAGGDDWLKATQDNTRRRLYAESPDEPIIKIHTIELDDKILQQLGLQKI